MEWFDEVRLSRHQIAEIGVAFYIRKMMKNRWIPSFDDLREAFGPSWREYVDSLKRSGMLKAEWMHRSVSLRIVAPGDKRRERNRKIHQRKRILKGKTNE